MVKSQISGQALLILYVVIIVAAYYFLLVLPQRKRAQARRKLIENLKVNSEVVTIGGIIGTVKSIREDVIMLQVDKDVTLKVAKDAIAQVIPKTKD